MKEREDFSAEAFENAQKKNVKFAPPLSFDYQTNSSGDSDAKLVVEDQEESL